MMTNRNAEGYRPDVMPRALKLMHAGDTEAGAEMDSEPISGGKELSDRPLFSRVGYVRFPTVDLDRSIDWYMNVLGFSLRAVIDNGSGPREAVFNFGDPPHNVAFLLAETNEHSAIRYMRDGRPQPSLTINCPDLDYTHRRLTEHGVEVTAIEGVAEARSFAFHDPDGNWIEAAWSIWD